MRLALALIFCACCLVIGLRFIVTGLAREEYHRSLIVRFLGATIASNELLAIAAFIVIGMVMVAGLYVATWEVLP